MGCSPQTSHLIIVSTYRVFLVYIVPYSARMRKNKDQKNSKYEHFSLSDEISVAEVDHNKPAKYF